MTYKTIQPPFTLNLREMPKADLRRYFQWFLEVLPGRIDELAEAVRGTPGFERWIPDRSVASLDTLGKWFVGQVDTRKRSEEEMRRISGHQPFPIEVGGAELTNRTFSLAMDVGMYFSQVLLESCPSLKWEQPLGNKRFVDYGQPVLSGFGKVTLNPVRVAVTTAYAAAKGNTSHKTLGEIYEYWAQRVQPGS